MKITSSFSPFEVDFLKNDNKVKLLLRNNEELIMDKSKLSHYSDYFRVIFSSKFSDSTSKIQRVRLVSSVDFQTLFSIPLNFENGLKPEISFQRAIQLLEPAAYLRIDIALDYLTDLISENLNAENVIHIFRLSLLYHTPLAIRAWRSMLLHFQTLFQTNLYLTLKEHELIGLLTDKHLNLKSEDEKAVVSNWITYNSPLDSDQIIQFAHKNFARKSMPDSARYEVIRTRQPSKAIVSLGGWASRGVAQTVEIFNSRSSRWQKCKFDYEIPDFHRAYHGVELVNDQLMVFGGFNGSNHFQTTILLDLTTKKWRRGMNMHDKRCYMTSTKICDSDGKHFVAACGGMNGIERMRTAELYDISNDKWMEIAEMQRMRSDGATTTIDNRIVCVGGFDGREILASGEIYDVISDIWYPLSSQMKTVRTGCSAVSVMSNVLMCIGGFNSTKRLDTVEMYDMREGIWHSVDVMHTSRSNFGACRLGDYSIHVAGGYDGQSTVKENEWLDLRNQRWQALPDMTEAKSALRLVEFSNNEFLDELFDIPEDIGIVKEW